jgi:hypothetical protein
MCAFQNLVCADDEKMARLELHHLIAHIKNLIIYYFSLDSYWYVFTVESDLSAGGFDANN